MARFVFILLFFFLLVVGIDYYVQHIASPVAYKPGLVPVEEEPAKEPKPEIPGPEPVPQPPPIPEKPEEPVKEPKPVCSLKKSAIEFYDYSMVQQTIAFEICDSVLRRSTENRINMKGKNGSKEYVKFDSKLIDPILDSYKAQIIKLKLNKIKAAEYIVASIQNIPYTLVHNHTHGDAENPATYTSRGVPAKQAKKYAKTLKDYHKKVSGIVPLEQPGGCLEEINYGLVTPIEMFINKMGDCDSRSTALFLILKKMGYDVIELISDVHQHAVLGLNLPGGNAGNIYYTFKGRKYYIWETTAFHPKETRLGVHKDGAMYMSNWAAWEVSLK